jgi:hypothetical protein
MSRTLESLFYHISVHMSTATLSQGALAGGAQWLNAVAQQMVLPSSFAVAGTVLGMYDAYTLGFLLT